MFSQKRRKKDQGIQALFSGVKQTNKKQYRFNIEVKL